MVGRGAAPDGDIDALTGMPLFHTWPTHLQTESQQGTNERPRSSRKGVLSDSMFV